jgi:hypothetical protein
LLLAYNCKKHKHRTVLRQKRTKSSAKARARATEGER